MAAVDTDRHISSHNSQQVLYRAKVIKDRGDLPKDLESRLQQAWLQTQINGRSTAKQNLPSTAGYPTIENLGNSQTFFPAPGGPANSSNQKPAEEPRRLGLKRQRSPKYGHETEPSGDLAGTLETLWMQTQSGIGGDFLLDSSYPGLGANLGADLSSATAASSVTPGVEVESWEKTSRLEAELKQADTRLLTDEEILQKLEAGQFEELFGGENLLGETAEEDFYRGLDELHDAFDEMEYHLPDVINMSAGFPEVGDNDDGNGAADDTWLGLGDEIAPSGLRPGNQDGEQEDALFRDIWAGTAAAHADHLTGTMNDDPPPTSVVASGHSLLTLEEQHAQESLAKIHKDCARRRSRSQQLAQSETSGEEKIRMAEAGAQINATASCQKPHAVEILIGVAKAIVTGDQEKLQAGLARLSQAASVYGDASQRLSAYFLQGLTVRLSNSKQEEAQELESLSAAPPTSVVEQDPETSTVENVGNHCSQIKSLLESFQVVMNASPYLTFGQVAANSAILEAFAGESHVHIIDFGSGYGLQWPALIQALAARPGGPPHIRLTAIEPQKGCNGNRPAYCLSATGKRLQAVARMWGVCMEYHSVESQLEDVTAEMVQLRQGEAVAANCALRLHQLLDETASSKDPRGAVLRTIRSLNPKVCTIVEQHTNHNSPFFLARFYEALYYYASLFESIDQSIPRDLAARRVFEQQVLGKAIVNVVACEGQDRVERQEPLNQWQQRMKSAGFRPRPVSESMVTTVKALLQTYRSGYGLLRGEGSLLLTWDDKPLIAMTAWQPDVL